MTPKAEPQYGPCSTRLDNQPTPSIRPWRYGHAASIEGVHWDIYAGEGADGWLVGMVTTEADAALIVKWSTLDRAGSLDVEPGTCPDCGSVLQHTYLGGDRVPDHRWPR